MNPSRNRAVRLLTGAAAGALALGALAAVPAPATAAAVPDQTRVASVSDVAGAAGVADAAVRVVTEVEEVPAAKPSSTTFVKNNRQLRRAVSKANRRNGTERIVLTSNVRLNPGFGKGNGPLKFDIDVQDDINLVGKGNTINARRVDRIFDVSPGTRLVLKNVTLRNGAPTLGESGGAVRATEATVVARNVTATDNRLRGTGASGGAFFNDRGVLRVVQPTLSQNVAIRAGGAIEANEGATTVSRTDLFGNAAGTSPGNGGAIHLTGDGTVDVDQSTAKFNVAAAEGGAFWNSEGGIFTVSESVLSSNVAAGDAADEGGGGLYNDGGVLSVETSQINNNFATGDAGSGGGILNNSGDLTVENTKMIQNSANRAGGAVEAVDGTTTTNGTVMRANVAGSAPGNGGALHLSGAGEVTVTGGRVVGNTAAAEGGGLWNSDVGTMEVAQVKIANNVAEGAEAVNGGGGLYNDGGTMLVRGSDLDDNDATGAAGSGGGILNNLGQLTVTNTSIDGGSAQRAGGAIEAVEGTTTLTRTSMQSNSAGPNPGNGGAVHLTGPGAVVVDDSTFGANSATEGGALWNSAVGTMSITSSEIIGNTANGAAADQGGGGVYTDGGELTITDSTINENSATGESGSGGGLLNNQATVTIASTTFSGNDAARAGGAIEANLGSTTLGEGTVLTANVTGANPGNGGGLHLTGEGTVEVTGATVTNNVAANEGGGLWNSATGTMTVTDTELSGNEAQGAAADNGGGGLYNDGGTLVVDGATLSGNTATGASGSGGGVLNNAGELTVTDSTFTGNDANRAGGGIETNVGAVVLTGVDFDANTTGDAPGNGGAYHATGAATTTYTGGAVTNNTAANEGGGLWCSNSGIFTATEITFEGNEAPEGDDVYHQEGGTVSICNINGQLVPSGSGLGDDS